MWIGADTIPDHWSGWFMFVIPDDKKLKGTKDCRQDRFKAPGTMNMDTIYHDERSYIITLVCNLQYVALHLCLLATVHYGLMQHYV